jgi:hypothetical protein
MKCTICTKPIVLVPSAAERAAKFGGKASDYTKLFTTHPQCALDKRNEQIESLIVVANYTFTTPQQYECFELYADGEHFDTYFTRAKAEHAEQFLKSQRY